MDAETSLCPASGSNAVVAARTPAEVLAAAIELLRCEFLPRASAKRQRLYDKVLRVLSGLQRRATRASGAALLRAPHTAQDEELDPRAWGLLLRRRREEADLTRAQLAALAGVADSTIRNVETGRHAPTRTIVLRLQAVPALKLPVLSNEPPPMKGFTAPQEFQGHCWLAPDFDPIEQSRELARVLRGHGGRLDPALLFLDPAGAAAWCALTSAGAHTSLPLTAVASEVSERLAGSPTDVLSLGAGESTAEVGLMQALYATGTPALRLLLLDVSPALLAAGFRRVSSALAGLRGASCVAVLGDLRRLPSYAPLLDAPRRRLVCLFGDTFSTLESEATFICHSLGVLSTGDLLLLEVPLALAVPQNEPHLQPEALVAPTETPFVEFLLGPLLRSGVRPRDVQLSAALDTTACLIPGSYAVEYQALVRTPNRQPRRFSLYHAKRYEPERLAESLTRMGWDLVERWPFGEPHSPRALLLLQKRA